jgi:A/G-specific adenine glycosylase
MFSDFLIFGNCFGFRYSDFRFFPHCGGRLKKLESKIQNPPLFRQQLARWFRAHGRDLPWRRTHDPYAIMVSEFMLQQTQVVTVRDFYTRWLARFPDFATLAAASEAEVLHAWQGLGYYSRARNLHRAAREVATRHGGTLPDDLAAIAALPGIGRYTAGAIASFAFDRATPIIDANIARVLARLLDLQEPIDTTRGAEILWQQAEALLPARGGRLHNSALMELGALLCTPRAPQCLICPVRAHCAAQDPAALPRKKPRRKTVALTEDCAWIVREGRLLLAQQTGPRWRGLWKLPALTSPPRAAKLLLTLEYPFTHHRVTLSVFAASAPSAPAEDQRWVGLQEIEDIALAAPHKRAILRLAASE